MEGWFTFEVGGGEFIFKSEGHPMGEALILMVGEVGGGGVYEKNSRKGETLPLDFC